MGGVDKGKRGIHMSWDVLSRLTFLSWCGVWFEALHGVWISVLGGGKERTVLLIAWMGI
jgi:hypothetical protein